jgi:hypothetical protein
MTGTAKRRRSKEAGSAAVAASIGSTQPAAARHAATSATSLFVSMKSICPFTGLMTLWLLIIQKK